MSINELESKARELRQLQALIDEAQQEAEAIKDAIKATELGRIIYTSLRLINAAIDEYHLTLGHYLEQRTEIFVERAAQVAKTIEAEKAFEAAREAGCSDSIKQARDLDNDSAIKLLTAAVMRRQTAEK